MKKFVILLLTIFTMSAAVLFGCSDENENSNFNKKIENINNIQTSESEDNNEQDCPECQDKPEFPNGEKRDGKKPQPHPHRPHLHPDDKLPTPKHTERNSNKE